MKLTDWTGKEYGVGDTVLYTSGIEGNGINYGVVHKIDSKAYTDYINGKYVTRQLRRVRIGSLFNDRSFTIIEQKHYVAFPSITRFDAGDNWTKPKEKF